MKQSMNINIESIWDKINTSSKIDIIKAMWENKKLEFEEINKYGWKFEIEQKKTTWLGLTSYRRTTVFLNKRHIIYGGYEDVMDTFNHEIAHILEKYRFEEFQSGHGDQWKKMCIVTGANPVACGKHSKIKSKYYLTCINGLECYKKRYDRKVKKYMTKYRCPNCSGDLHYENNPEYKS